MALLGYTADGDALDMHGRTEEEFLASYDLSAYPQPSVTVDNVVFTVCDDDLRVLLVRRGGHPFLGCWALPGGFMGIDESTDEAVQREVEEETGIRISQGIGEPGQVGFYEQLRTFADVGRDPRGRIVSVAHMTLLPYRTLAEATAGDDADDAAWFSVRQGDAFVDLTRVVADGEADGEVIRIPRGDDGLAEMVGAESLAFDHGDILLCALGRLVAKVGYSCLAFALLDTPEEFTITELRHIYEAVTGERQDPGNFQRMFKRTFWAGGLVSEVGQTRTEGRPARLYRYDGGLYETIVR